MTAPGTTPKEDTTRRLHQLSAELRQLTEEIKSGDVDALVLRDLRETIDNFRATAWVVQSWLEKQGQRADPYPLLPLLAAERIRRTTQLSRNLVSDLNAIEVTIESEGLRELCGAVESLSLLLARLFKKA